jgi:protein-S-isoprenylcysteine O-methyltransferase Ste14
MSIHYPLLAYPWIVVGAVWLATAARRKKAVERQPLGRCMANVLLLFLGYFLMASSWLGGAWLRVRFVPDTSAVYAIGFAVTVIGAGFAIWARLTLGANWSGRPSLVAGHELVTSGPYAVARHPIYTGLVTGTAGSAVAIGEWHCVLGALLVLSAFLLKVGAEERFMLQAFPEAYPRYRARVKALIPGVF